MSKSIKKNLLYNIALNLSKVIFPLITAPYVSRVLEPDGVGLFNFSYTYAGYFALFAVLGIPLYGVREIAKLRDSKSDENRFLSEIISLEIVVTILVSAIFLITVLLIPRLNENYAIFLIAGVALYISPCKVEWFFSGREEFGFITIRSLSVKVLSIIALFLFVHDKNDLIIYVILGALATVANELWNYGKLIKDGYRPHLTNSFKKHLKPLFVLFASTVAVSIYTMLDTLMLGFMSDYDQVGFYNNANHIAKSLMPVVTSLAAVAMPRLSYYMQSGNWDDINLLMKKSLSIVSFLAFPITVGVVIVAPTFVPLFFGELFYGAILPLQILVWVVTIIGLNNITAIQVLASMGYDTPYLKSVLSGTISNFVLNLLLIPILGAVGASISSVIAEIAVLVISTIYVYKKTPIRFTSFRELLNSGLVVLGFLPIAYFSSIVSNGWYFVGLFTIIAGLYYIIAQLALKNMSAIIFYNLIINKLHKHE